MTNLSHFTHFTISLAFKCNIFGCSRWVKFYPPVRPSELYFIWNIWHICLICYNQNNNAFTQTRPKQTLFFKGTSIHLIHTCKQKSLIFNHKVFHLFPPPSDKKACWKEIALILGKKDSSVLLNRRYNKSNFNACYNTSMSQPVRLYTRRTAIET